MAFDDLVELNLTFMRFHTSGSSFQIEDADGKRHWLPVSECDLDPLDPDNGDDVLVSLPEWLAQKEGLI